MYFCSVNSSRVQFFVVGFLIFILAIVFTIFSDGCGTSHEKRTAVSYHDSLIVHQKRIVDQTDKLNAAIETYVKEDMEKEHENLLKQLSATSLYIQNTTPFENDTTLRKGLKKLSDSYLLLANTEYNQVIDRMKKDDSSFTNSDQQFVDSLNKEIDRKTEVIYKDFATRVKNFRIAYNIIVK